MNKPLPFPYDADKVSILIPREDGDYHLVAVLSRPKNTLGWPTLVEETKASYGDTAEVWSRMDARDMIDGLILGTKDVICGDVVRLTPGELADYQAAQEEYLELEAKPHVTFRREFPKADLAFIKHVRRGLSRKRV